MSSTYKVLCLSHDPAITADDGYHSAAEAERAIQNGVEGHETCDLMIGAYSYPLVNLGCPGLRPDGRRLPAGCTGYHKAAKWVDVAWIRILAHAQQQPAGSELRTLSGANEVRCFSPERLRRLYGELNISLVAPVAAAAPETAASMWPLADMNGPLAAAAERADAARRRQLTAPEAEVMAGLNAIGVTGIVRIDPVEEVAAEGATLAAFADHCPRLLGWGTQSGLNFGGFGPLFTDPTLPPGQVHLRPRTFPKPEESSP